MDLDAVTFEETTQMALATLNSTKNGILRKEYRLFCVWNVKV
jgi:hypothetical protein